MKPTTESSSVRIDKDQYKALKRISKTTGISMINLMRFAIKQYLAMVGKNAAPTGGQNE